MLFRSGVNQAIDEDLVRRMAGVTDRSYLFRLSDAIAAKDGAGALSELAALRQQSVDMKRLADELVGHYRNLMLAALPGGKSLLTGVSPEEEKLYLEKAAQTPQAESIRAIRAIGSAMEKMTRGSNQRIALELALFTLTEGPLEAPVQVVQQVTAPVAAPTAQTVQPFAAAPLPVQTTVTVTPEAPAQPAPQELPPWDLPASAPEAAAPVQDVPQSEAKLTTEETPPWENQPAPPQEVPAPAEKPAPAPEPTPPAPAEKPAPGPFAPWAQVVQQLESYDNSLYSFLKDSKAYYDGRRVLIDGGNMFRDFIRVNKDSQRRLKNMIKQVTGMSCGIGPYEAPQQAEVTGNAEETLAQLEQQGLDVFYKN